MSSTMACALSGEPLNFVSDEVVVTPSGCLCRKSLLLSKLAENGGTDPFQPDRPLSTDDLVTLSTNSSQSVVVPPRPSSTSLSFLLKQMQTEYDSLVLELFDTRKALEETRRELSQALYQNDASIRVVARLAMERDAARQELQQWNANSVQQKTAVSSAAHDEGPSAKRRRVDVVPANEQEEEATGVKEASIPTEHLSAMEATWKTLSKNRKATLKATKAVSKEELASFAEVDSKSWHKTRSKAGILACASFENLIVTAGRDKQIIIYDDTEKVLVNTISNLPAVTSSLDVSDNLIVCGSEDGSIRLYAVQPQDNDGPSLLDELDLKSQDDDKVVHVEFHPTKQHVLATTQQGRVNLCGIATQNEETKLSLITYFQSKETEYSCGALHPDGFIYAAGTSKGDVEIWDLKSQNLASTLKQPQDQEEGSPLTSVVFSNNGYHVATCSMDNKAVVWDLRKGKVLATLNDSDNSEENLDSVLACAFDASGKYLAFGGKGGTIVTAVKEWNVTARLARKHHISEVLWIDGILATCSNKERPIRFHGIKK